MITVKLFGTLRIDSGVKEVRCEAARVKDLYDPVLAAIREKQPETDICLKTLKGCRIAVNGVEARPGAKLSDGDTVYFFPAVAGG